MFLWVNVAFDCCDLTHNGYVSPIKNMEATCTFSHLCYIHGPPIFQFVARKCTEFVQQYCMTLWTSNHSVIKHSFYWLTQLLHVRFKRQVFFVIGPLNWHWLKIGCSFGYKYLTWKCLQHFFLLCQLHFHAKVKFNAFLEIHVYL